MPLIEKRTIHDSILGIWKLEEPVTALRDKLNLLPEDINSLQEIKIEERKKQWLAVRVMVNSLLQESQELSIVYDNNNKPSIKNSKYKISISHSYDSVALIADSKNETGIDIELIKPTIQKIVHKFLSEPELKNIDTAYSIEQMYVYWCAKEALYKLYGKKELDFKRNLIINDFEYKNKGLLTAKIIKGALNQACNLWYEKMKNYMLVYIINP